MGRPLKPIPLSEALRNNFRISTLDLLPGVYPFWSRHAALTGMTWLDFTTSSGGGVRNSVTIDLSDSDFNFTQTPLILAWFRDANADLTYSDSTPIYRFPIVRRNTSGVELESFNTSFFADYDQLYFVRHGITAYGSAGTKRIYIKFFLFKDDAFLNSDSIAELDTL